jgi:diguanylate cyclase (GGDEF)-like protein
VDCLCDLFRNLGNSLELETLLSTLDQELHRLMAYDALTVYLCEDSGGLALAYASGKFSGGGTELTFPVEQVAVLVFERGDSEFSGHNLDILRALRPKLAVSIENAKKYRRVEQLAERDPGTGLANVRSLFQRLDAELARARRCHGTLAVLHCSIRGLDRSCRLCPPAATRSAFERVARALHQNCREYDLTARSGDDVVLLLPGFRPEHLADRQELIQKAVEETGINAGFPLFVDIGAAFFPDDGRDAEDLLATAARRAHGRSPPV